MRGWGSRARVGASGVGVVGTGNGHVLSFRVERSLGRACKVLGQQFSTGPEVLLT
jgi:hypothetical protein